MRLFHFTGREHIEGINREGITHGAMLMPDGTLQPWCQWLTKSPEWAQAWATQHIVHCDRSEVRLEVQVPNHARQWLERWVDYSRRFPEPWVREFNEAGGGAEAARDWYVFRGVIPRVWVLGRDDRPELGKVVIP